MAEREEHRQTEICTVRQTQSKLSRKVREKSGTHPAMSSIFTALMFNALQIFLRAGVGVTQSQGGAVFLGRSAAVTLFFQQLA